MGTRIETKYMKAFELHIHFFIFLFYEKLLQILTYGTEILYKYCSNFYF